MTRKTIVQLFGGAEANRTSYTLKERELFLTTDDWDLHGGDGSTAGGKYLAPFFNMHVGYTSGDYQGSTGHVGSAVSATWPAGFIMYKPILFSTYSDRSLVQVNSLGCVITTAGAGRLGRVALFTDDGARPKSLIVETAPFFLNAVGLVTSSITTTTLKPGWYWTAFQDGGSGAVFSSQRQLTTLGNLPNAAGVASTLQGYVEVWAYGAFPATAGTLIGSSSNNPIINVGVV